jgi:hypothetical protein
MFAAHGKCARVGSSCAYYGTSADLVHGRQTIFNGATIFFDARYIGQFERFPAPSAFFGTFSVNIA